MTSTQTKRIVVVEDDEWQLEQHLRVIRRAGYEAVGVGNAAAAIDLIDESQPDVIVLDILLTGLTAMTLLHELQSHDDLGAIPVVICSSVGADITVERLRDYGVVHVLDKTTMHPDDVVSAIKGVLA